MQSKLKIFEQLKIKQIIETFKQTGKYLLIKNSITFAPKTWRNEKDEIYLQKFITNLKKIKQDHVSIYLFQVIKADNIINKHFNLSMKNRALRQKKDRIFQAIRK